MSDVQGEGRSSHRRSRFDLRHFLNRSRSRSRSKQDSELDTKSESHRVVRRLSLKKTKENPMSGTKPASRIPSRPISSTTTATSTTITPGKVKRDLPRPQPEPRKPVQDDSLGKNSSGSTNKGSGTKKRLQNLFSQIPNALSRRTSRSRSRSRPNTPDPSSNVPPLPVLGLTDDLTPKPRPPDPPPSSSSNPSKLPKLFSARQSLDLTQNSTSSTPKSTVSAPNIKKPSAVRRILKPESTPDSSSLAKPSVSQSVKPPPGSESVQQQPSPPPSKKTPPNGNGHIQSLPTIRGKSLHTPKFSSMDAGYRFKGGNMSVVDEEGRRSTDLEKSQTSSRTREPEPSSLQLRSGVPKMTTATRDVRHGSFDFERPGWGTTVLQRTGSNGTTGSVSTHTSKATETPAQPQGTRESAFGAGLAGVGTLQRDKSIKRLKDTEEQIKARQRAERLHEHIQRDKLPPLPTVNGNGSSSNHSENLHASTSTNGTGKPSSLGKSTGKRVMANGSRIGVGLTRLMGTPQHSPFPFEPPVPSPTWSTASNGTAVETTKHGRRLKEEGKKSQGTPKKVPAVKGDRSAIPVPSSGHRPGNRGRSLDLGIGLAWAPSQIKENALMPSTTLFARTASSSSGPRSVSGSTVARTPSNSTNGADLNGRSRRGFMHEPEPQPVEVERTKMGREVADLFRNVLDDRGYNTFKTYVRRFDAHEIPFDGRNGIVERVERLLRDSPSIPVQERRTIMEKFIRIILQNA